MADPTCIIVGAALAGILAAAGAHGTHAKGGEVTSEVRQGGTKDMTPRALDRGPEADRCPSRARGSRHRDDSGSCLIVHE